MKRVFFIFMVIVLSTNLSAQENMTPSPFWDRWGLDVMPSVAVGISGMFGDHLTVPQCGMKLDGNVQFYQKRSGVPHGWLSEAALGYALCGGGGMPLNYFSFRLSPAGYAYPLPHEITIWGLLGVNLFAGGGKLVAYYDGIVKYYYGTPVDVGVQLKFAAEWHNISAAISYDQGFTNTIINTPLTLKSYGVYLHAAYRLWIIPQNKINIPKL